VGVVVNRTFRLLSFDSVIVENIAEMRELMGSNPCPPLLDYRLTPGDSTHSAYTSRVFVLFGGWWGSLVILARDEYDISKG
jgi:hypothetical protein